MNFSQNASHELRTPLNAIVGWTKMLRRGTLNPTTASSAMETIERSANAQTKLIEDLLRRLTHYYRQVDGGDASNRDRSGHKFSSK